MDEEPKQDTNDQEEAQNEEKEFETVDLNDGGDEMDGGDENDGGEGDQEIPDMADMLPPTDVPMLSHLFISMLTNSAWQHLGLIPDPKTQQIAMDLKQAGLAIDIVEFLYVKLKDDMEPELAKGVEDLLANLRINFVSKSTSASAPAEGSEPGNEHENVHDKEREEE